MSYIHMLLIAGLAGTTPAFAQHGKVPDQDPVRVKYADSRQYRNEPKGNAAKRMTRCKIVVRKGQDKRVCGVPTDRSPGDGRNR
jgi:hypothetical protein